MASRDMEEKAVKLIKDVITDFTDKGVTDDEVRCVCEQAKSNILMGLESTSTRMHRLGRGELFSGRTQDVDEICAAYDRITKEDIKRLAETHLDFEASPSPQSVRPALLITTVKFSELITYDPRRIYEFGLRPRKGSGKRWRSARRLHYCFS